MTGDRPPARREGGLPRARLRRPEDEGGPERFQRPPASSAAVWIILASLGGGVLLLGVLGLVALLVFWPAGAVWTPVPAVVQPAASALQPRARLFVADASCLSLSADASRLAIGSYDKTIRIYDLRTQQELAVLAGHDQAVHSVALAPDGQSLASAGEDGLVLLWDIARKERVHTIRAKADKPLVRFLGDGKTLAIAGVVPGVRLLDVPSRKVKDTLPGWLDISALDVTPDGQFLATALAEIHVWDLSTRKEHVIPATAHRGLIEAVALTADGKTVVSGSADSTIKVWDVETGKARLVIPQGRPVVNMVMTPDGRLIASAGLTEGKIHLWSGMSGKEVATLDTFGPLVIAGDGKTMVTGAGRQWVYVWDLSGF